MSEWFNLVYIKIHIAKLQTREEFISPKIGFSESFGHIQILLETIDHNEKYLPIIILM